MIKGTWWKETVGSVTMVSDVVVEAERVDESYSAARFHWFGGWRIVEVVGEVAEMSWGPKR